jgi:hypothetical protein
MSQGGVWILGAWGPVVEMRDGSDSMAENFKMGRLEVGVGSGLRDGYETVANPRPIRVIAHRLRKIVR